jgi:hypothetical protein
MSQFKTIKAAKDYLANRIAAQAVRENIPLSESERKMLYFSETDWTLPDMKQVSAEFDRDYDQNEYEQKIASLICNIQAHHYSHNREEEESWDQAVEKLGEGDHYLSVLVGAAHSAAAGFLPTFVRSSVRPRHDRLKLWGTASAIVLGFMVLLGLGNWLFGSRFWTVMDWLFDRNHSGLLILAAIAVWAAWNIRDDLKMIVRGILSRR